MQDALLINQILKEIQLIPQEQWENLLQIMRTFRQATTIANEGNSSSDLERERQEQIKKKSSSY